MNTIKKHFLTIIAIAGIISMPIFQLQGSEPTKSEGRVARARKQQWEEFKKGKGAYLYKHRYKIGTGAIALGAGAVALYRHRAKLQEYAQPYRAKLQEYAQPHYERGKAYLYSFTPAGRRAQLEEEKLEKEKNEKFYKELHIKVLRDIENSIDRHLEAEKGPN